MHTDCAGVTNRSVGVRRSKNWVERLTPPFTFGSRENASSVRAVGASWALSCGASGRTSAPVSSAEAIVGEFSLRARTPGRRSANSVALWPRKVLIGGEVRIRVSSVGGVSEIVCWMKGRATDARAPNVVSRETNIWAWVSATGATSAAVSARARKNRSSPVLGDARFRATGSRRSRSGRSSPRAAFRSGPRPASASPNPTRFPRIARRVGSSNVFRTWSISTGFGWAALSGRIAPSG